MSGIAVGNPIQTASEDTSNVEVNGNVPTENLLGNPEVLSRLQSVVVNTLDVSGEEVLCSTVIADSMVTLAEATTIQSIVTPGSSNANSESVVSVNGATPVTSVSASDQYVEVLASTGAVPEPVTYEAVSGVDIDELVEDVEIENDGFIGDVRSHYLIVNADGTTSVGYGNLEDNHLSPGEPATKRYRIEGNDGQAYLLTLANSMPNGTEESPRKASSPRIFPNRPAEPTTNMTNKGIEKRNQLLGSDISQAWFTTKDDKMILQSNGANWRQGQWTKAEVDMLQVNISEYCKKHNISDPTEIIFEMSKDERKEFYRSVAKGLQRPLFSVYRRVTRMYDQKNHMGKYSPEEMMKLRELRHKHGNDWATIGQALGRSASSVKDKCRLMKDTCNSGKWLPEEERRLSKAVYDLSGATAGENVVKGLCWQSVAEQVITRSDKQCRTKWLNYLNWKERAGKDWSREDDITLILKVGGLGANDDTEIDWDLLANQWDSVRSPQWLRGKWWSLKRHIPDYQLLPYDKLLEFMKTFYFQNVRVKIKSPPNKGNSSRTAGCMKVPTVAQPGSEILNYIPVVMVPGLTVGEDGLASGDPALQNYEVLQQLPNSGGLQYIISQPHGAQSMPEAKLPEHIIVHTLPVSQVPDCSSLDTTAQIVISCDPSASDCLPGVVSLEAKDLGSELHLTGTPQGLGVMATDTGMSHSDPLVDDAAFDTHPDIVHSGNIGIHIKSEDQSPVLVTPSFGQPGRNDGQLMTSFSDPMLNSDSNNMMESASDIVGDKAHNDDLGVNLE